MLGRHKAVGPAALDTRHAVICREAARGLVFLFTTVALATWALGCADDSAVSGAGLGEEEESALIEGECFYWLETDAEGELVEDSEGLPSLQTTCCPGATRFDTETLACECGEGLEWDAESRACTCPGGAADCDLPYGEGRYSYSCRTEKHKMVRGDWFPCLRGRRCSQSVWHDAKLSPARSQGTFWVPEGSQPKIRVRQRDESYLLATDWFYDESKRRILSREPRRFEEKPLFTTTVGFLQGGNFRVRGSVQGVKPAGCSVSPAPREEDGAGNDETGGADDSVDDGAGDKSSDVGTGGLFSAGARAVYMCFRTGQCIDAAAAAPGAYLRGFIAVGAYSVRAARRISPAWRYGRAVEDLAVWSSMAVEGGQPRYVIAYLPGTRFAISYAQDRSLPQFSGGRLGGVHPAAEVIVRNACEQVRVSVRGLRCEDELELIAAPTPEAATRIVTHIENSSQLTESGFIIGAALIDADTGPWGLRDLHDALYNYNQPDRRLTGQAFAITAEELADREWESLSPEQRRRIAEIIRQAQALAEEGVLQSDAEIIQFIQQKMSEDSLLVDVSLCRALLAMVKHFSLVNELPEGELKILQDATINQLKEVIDRLMQGLFKRVQLSLRLAIASGCIDWIDNQPEGDDDSPSNGSSSADPKKARFIRPDCEEDSSGCVYDEQIVP